MTVRIVAGDGDGNGGGMGPSIRVRIVDDVVEGPVVADAGPPTPSIADAPPLLEPPLAEKTAAPTAEELSKLSKPAEDPTADATAAVEPLLEASELTAPLEASAAIPEVKTLETAAIVAPAIEPIPQPSAEYQAALPTFEEKSLAARATPRADGPTVVAIRTPTASQATSP
jgi:hypothetical protein